MPVERMHPHLSKGYAYVEFEIPDEAEKSLKHVDGGQLMAKRARLLLCWPPGSATPSVIPLTQENASTTSHVAQVIHNHDEVLFPKVQVPHSEEVSISRSPHRSHPSSNSFPQAGTSMCISITYVPWLSFVLSLAK